MVKKTRSMEEKIRDAVCVIYRGYGAGKSSDYPLRENRITILCMNDIASHPGLEELLDSDNTIRYYVMQTILYDVPTEEIKRLC